MAASVSVSKIMAALINGSRYFEQSVIPAYVRFPEIYGDLFGVFLREKRGEKCIQNDSAIQKNAFIVARIRSVYR